MVQKIRERDNLVKMWREERRGVVQHLHEREIEMAQWSDDFLQMVGYLRRADIEARARDGDRDVIIQLLHRQYPTRRDGRICRELRKKIQAARRTWRNNTLGREVQMLEEELWPLSGLFNE